MTKVTDIPANIKFIFDALCHAENIKIDFEEVAKEQEITRANNARKKFRETMKAYGFTYEGTTLTRAGDGIVTAAAIPSSSAKKRKPVSNEDLAADTPTKPSKSKKVKVGSTDNGKETHREGEK